MLIIDLILGAIVVATALMLLTVMMHFLLRVPFVPTPAHIVDAMVDMVEWKGTEKVLDLGAGDGRLLIAVKKKFPSVTAVGYEIVPTIWLLGIARSFLSRARITLRMRSCMKADVRDADVVFLYLFPSLMERLAPRFDSQLRPGTVVVSQTFGFLGRAPEKSMQLPHWGGEVTVFFYRWQNGLAAPMQSEHRAEPEYAVA